MVAGSAANAIAATLGFHTLTATLVRYRVYRGAGVSATHIAAIISLSSTAVLLSFPVTFSWIGIWSSASAGFVAHKSAIWIGLASLGLLGAALGWLAGKPKSIKFRQVVLDLPSARVAICQVAIGSLEMTAAIGGLYVLLPVGLLPPFPIFALTYIGAVAGGLISHVPGGLGVFEAAMLAGLGADGVAGVVAALLAYRLLYNLLPFVIALCVLSANEFISGREGGSASSPK